MSFLGKNYDLDGYQCLATYLSGTFHIITISVTNCTWGKAGEGLFGDSKRPLFFTHSCALREPSYWLNIHITYNTSNCNDYQEEARRDDYTRKTTHETVYDPANSHCLMPYHCFRAKYGVSETAIFSGYQYHSSLLLIVIVIIGPCFKTTDSTT